MSLPPSYSEEIAYHSSDFPSHFEFVKKLIADLAHEPDEFDIIVKKTKVSNEKSSPFPVKSVKKRSRSLKTLAKIKNRYKNSPKLFGRAFFRMLLKSEFFAKEHLTEQKLMTLSPSGINYPEDPKILRDELSISQFIQWVKDNNFHTYNNLHFYRDIWNYKKNDRKNDNSWVTQHFKFFLTMLMKEFFQLYAFEYVLNSKIHAKNGLKYLSLIPLFLRGIDDPEKFTCLKYGKTYEN